MLNFLPVFIQFPLHVILQILNLALWGTLIILMGIPKLLLPFPPLTRMFNQLLNFFMGAFAFCSVSLINIFNRVEWDYQVEGELKQDGWYLMMANHISWLDIILLMRFAGGRIPATKFFIKQELIWMPFVGLGAWALDMPFMRRYSAEFLARNPHLRGKDIETTKRSCEKFRTIPTSVINFVEGTRYTEQKHAKHSSPYQYLLKPKAGGVAFTLATMGNLFSDIIDMTLLYPHNREHVMLDVLSGRLTKVVLHARVLPVQQELIGDYHADESFRERFQQWVNQLWAHKDNYIRRLMEAK
ncbi:acyltransferase [Aliiglaciecola sp. CAU 1673]|uniref:acyltransferase n=1 Tax=Aliiglaciecola sp. CAU 1673 TaxID=3032595 RepID=UPI0023DCA613|nr:acyltransferase [Aliiglaciecola sp. CAU 1673]MDF2180293.1 acyltransferase [Aliiglaciecola sp. CAU 1673]